ncbi:MAG: glycosyltransferase family 2 protein [Clostridiales bacterium]|nr:glycosyltransferase family 2 protein [Clostridiales bacterium]
MIYLQNPILYLVVPCYNEEEALPETSRQVTKKLKTLIEQKVISEDSRVLLVDDGSKDDTWELITDLHQANPLYQGLKLSRNRGHQQALLAGLMTAKEKADIVISMDADLQDDIHAIDGFIQEYKNGHDVVYGVRSKRDTDTAFKRTTAEFFYKFMRFLGVDIVNNHADYRLMSKEALNALAAYEEVNLFLRGIVPLIGFPSTSVYYERNARLAGESKYPLKKMIAFALDGITSFSIKPIRFVLSLGIIVFLFSLIMLVYALVSKLTGNASTGWTSIVGSIWMIGGIQLLSLGVIGEYIGKIYNETKRRPRYIIETYLDDKE